MKRNILVEDTLRNTFSSNKSLINELQKTARDLVHTLDSYEEFKMTQSEKFNNNINMSRLDESCYNSFHHFHNYQNEKNKTLDNNNDNNNNNNEYTEKITTNNTNSSMMINEKEEINDDINHVEHTAQNNNPEFNDNIKFQLFRSFRKRSELKNNNYNRVSKTQVAIEPFGKTNLILRS